MKNTANDPMEFLDSVWKDPHCHMIDRIRCAQLVVNLTLEKERHDRISACVEDDVEDLACLTKQERLTNLWHSQPWVLYSGAITIAGLFFVGLWRSLL